jgi:gas vesicle protein
MAGVLVGAAAAMLLAPQGGAEIRNALKEYATKAVEDILDTALQSGRAYVEAMIEQGKEYIEHNVQQVLEPAKSIGALR